MPLKLSPAGRSSLIIGGLFFAFIAIGTYGVSREAQRIPRQREATRIANAEENGEMVWIAPGRFTMGGIGDDIPSDELPLHDVKIDGFWMDRTEVTNAQFTKFVKATGYLTVAERPMSAKTTPGLLPEYEGKGVSLCFRAPGGPVNLADVSQWWEPVVGANWQHPSGPDSDLKGRENHPVVHVCNEDAMAYCKWAGKRLPTEAEWEFAARGGLVAQPFIWGKDVRPEGKFMANTWQGVFPGERKVEDGFDGTAPVMSFPANGYGLYDLAGNVWEMTSDWYRPDTYAALARIGDRAARRNPKGPDNSYDPDEPGTWKKVTRGGSWMCADNYCRGYRPSARMKTAVDTGLQNTGFRCAKDGPVR